MPAKGDGPGLRFRDGTTASREFRLFLRICVLSHPIETLTEAISDVRFTSRRDVASNASNAQ